MVGGAWPFLVRGAICLVNSDNERDSCLLNTPASTQVGDRSDFLEGQAAFSRVTARLSNNRSVMPSDVRGRTRATLLASACVYPAPAGVGNPLNRKRARDREIAIILASTRNSLYLRGSSARGEYCPCPLYTPPVATTD